jgi:NADP-dependent 3-hydroxy acid dehydrogenase YdfG
VSNNIADKIVVITGASGGLGEAAARHLSAEGAIVVLGARRVERIQALAKALTAKSRPWWARPCRRTDALTCCSTTRA